MAKQVYVNCELVKKLVQEKGLTLATLAEKVGSTKATLTKWLEKGEQDGMLLMTLIRIGRALEVDWRTLLKD